MKNWETVENALVQTFSFQDFTQAWAFMNEVAQVAEEQNHHPDWHNISNRVTIRLSTHDAKNTITEKDHRLAKSITEIAENRASRRGVA